MIIVSDTISIDLLEYITADEYDNSSSISVNSHDSFKLFENECKLVTVYDLSRNYTKKSCQQNRS